MTRVKILISVLVSLLIVNFVSAQRPPRGGDDDERFGRLDANRNGTIERGEIFADADRIFKMFDRNADGALDEIEVPKPGQARERTSPTAIAPEAVKPPPHFMMRDENRDGRLTRAEFDENVKRHFAVMDANDDGTVTREEFFQMHENERHREKSPSADSFAPRAPTVRFLGAEMRFGDKLVKDAPFSAETVMENTRRLYDGSTVTTQAKGAIYRDQTGRTRREQPLENVGAFSLGNESQRLIFITDASEGTQYFLDAPRRTARKIPLSADNRPPKSANESGEGKTESLGRKVLEGVMVEGTRTVIEISANNIGGDKPLQIISERWFSPELQTVVMSRHVDPLLGEQVFRLTNVKRSEPARELFVVPNDYKIEIDRQPR